MFGERSLNNCAPAAFSTKTAVSKREESKVQNGELWKAILEDPLFIFMYLRVE